MPSGANSGEVHDAIVERKMTKRLYEMKGQEYPAQRNARELGISSNPASKYLRCPEALRINPRPLRGNKLDPCAGYVDGRLSEGLDRCAVSLRELTGV